MTQPRKPPTRRTPEQKAEYHAAKLASARKAVADQARSADAHRKIVVGASLIGLADAGDPAAVALLTRIRDGLVRDRDRAAFGLEPIAATPAAGLTAEEADAAVLAALAAHKAVPDSDVPARRATQLAWREAVAAWERITGRMRVEAEKRANVGLGDLGEVSPRTVVEARA